MGLRPSFFAASFAFILGSLGIGGVRDARACGGCFHPQAEVGSSVVTDHRMVFKVSVNETILWDQVRYTGSPDEFAWVLPVRDGAKVELSRDAWIAALDATTRTTVTGPERSCGGGGGGSSSGGGGCGSATMLASDNSRASFGGAADAGFSGNGQVSVLSQSVIGPYQAVTLRANGGQGISEWLLSNGFAIPNEVKPTVDAYTAERFDFIALRLRPGQGVQAMRPVRVVTPGADATLPLRMVAAGVGAKVGLTLWVISEGRYRTQNFPNGVVDDDKLVWDGAASRSNLTDLQTELLAANGGRTWLTEMAGRVNTSKVIFQPGSTDLSLYSAYNSQCITRAPERVRCTEDDLPPADGQPTLQTDAGLDPTGDAGEGDAGEGDAGKASDASTPVDPGKKPDDQCFKIVSGCEGFDDLDVALHGMHSSDLWVTRLRADLPVSALAADLRLEASDQVEVKAVHHTDKFSDASFDPCNGVRGGSSSSSSSSDDSGCACRSSRPIGSSIGTWLIIGLTLVLASKLARRR